MRTHYSLLYKNTLRNRALNSLIFMANGVFDIHKFSSVQKALFRCFSMFSVFSLVVKWDLSLRPFYQE